MKEELDVILRLTKKDEEEIREAVKSGNEESVYTRFDCKSNIVGVVNQIFCRGCQHAYKIDIRRPWSFGCYVVDYVRQVKKQLEIK